MHMNAFQNCHRHPVNGDLVSFIQVSNDSGLLCAEKIQFEEPLVVVESQCVGIELGFPFLSLFKCCIFLILLYVAIKNPFLFEFVFGMLWSNKQGHPIRLKD